MNSNKGDSQQQSRNRWKHKSTVESVSAATVVKLCSLLCGEQTRFTIEIGSKWFEIQAEWQKQTQWKITFSSEKHVGSY